MAHRMISVPDATATILSLSPSEPAITFALSATLSITQSRRGEVKTCCHPVDSFTLTDRKTWDRWTDMHHREQRQEVTVKRLRQHILISFLMTSEVSGSHERTLFVVICLFVYLNSALFHL